MTSITCSQPEILSVDIMYSLRDTVCTLALKREVEEARRYEDGLF